MEEPVPKKVRRGVFRSNFEGVEGEVESESISSMSISISEESGLKFSKPFITSDRTSSTSETSPVSTTTYLNLNLPTLIGKLNSFNEFKFEKRWEVRGGRGGPISVHSRVNISSEVST